MKNSSSKLAILLINANQGLMVLEVDSGNIQKTAIFAKFMPQIFRHTFHESGCSFGDLKITGIARLQL